MKLKTPSDLPEESTMMPERVARWGKAALWWAIVVSILMASYRDYKNRDVVKEVKIGRRIGADIIRRQILIEQKLNISDPVPPPEIDYGPMP